MTMYGMGFNPHIFTGKFPMPTYVKHIEVGLNHLQQWVWKYATQEPALSLHLARTPITESSKTQDKFIQYLENIINHHQLRSIGIHLTGQRTDNIGRFGFSSHFVPDLTSVKQAKRFLSKMHSTFSTPIWLENANFYSESPQQIINTLNVTNNIAEESNCDLIIDLSHLAIDAHNVGLEPLILLGAVNWNRAVELHLSGITQGYDKTWHDNHSVKVHSVVWQLLEESLKLIPEDRQDVTYTIEHTDPGWINSTDTLISDFAKLRTIMSTHKHSKKNVSCSTKAECYAISYLKKISKTKFPDVAKKLGHELFDNMLVNWVNEVISDSKRVALTRCEIPEHEMEQVRILGKDFIQYLSKEVP